MALDRSLRSLRPSLAMIRHLRQSTSRCVISRNSCPLVTASPLACPVRSCCLAGCAHAASSGASAPDRGCYDVVIENGRIVDGTGNPWIYGDVGIRGDRIAAVTPRGALRNASAKQRIDARGHIVAPGFIDIQAHSWDDAPVARRTRRQQGHAGRHQRDPRRSDDAGAVERRRSTRCSRSRTCSRRVPRCSARSAASTASAPGSTRWASHANSVNVGSYLGATTVRAYAMGQAPGAPNAAQLDTMRAVVRNAMRDGAFGISSALIYPPGSYAGTPRADRDGEGDGAVSRRRTSRTCARRTTRCSRRWTKRSASRARAACRLDIYHLKASNRRNWGKAPAMVAKIDSARAAGLDVGATMYPYPFSGNNLGECFPDWAAENGKLFDNLQESGRRARASCARWRTRTVRRSASAKARRAT